MAVLYTPVLIVGAGVAGSVLALELAHHGVPSIVVERATRDPRHRELNLVSGRSMELLRRLGLSDAIRPHGIDPDGEADVLWVRGLDQPPVLVSRLPSVNQLLSAYAQGGDGRAPVEPYLVLPGSELTGRLRAAARAHPLVDLREGWTFTDLRPSASDSRTEGDQGGAVAVLLEAGTGVRHVVQARYLAGCDGAQSTVRRCLGVVMEHLTTPVQHYTVYFRSDEMTDGPAHPRTIITAGLTLSWRPDEDLWIGYLPLSADEATTADPAALLQDRLGLGPDAAEIVAVAQSEESPRVAAAYQRGPVYLAGEAAHRFHPPGDTVDTCVGDAVDLGWKLAAAVRGWGGPALLASYEDERRRRALIDQELASRALETRSRFGRLADAGASHEVLAGVLGPEPAPTDVAGTGPADGAGRSAVVWREPGAVTRTVPGCRPPAVRMSDGGQLFDRLGPQFTLVDLTDGAHGTALVATAEARGIPMRHLTVADTVVRACWEEGLVLVRPDQHVAWRSGADQADWDRVLDVVTGHRSQEHVNT
ncbi:FAD-dependent monooxygenase [Actinoplanes sp. NPDC051494]|uniref:FAD-dependent monooxygenase n=1 Tax=Actinoplanes sp. NPDC051494 TaxID=3363907 RepID=UPI0037AA345C